jgi:hypothetical protein
VVAIPVNIKKKIYTKYENGVFTIFNINTTHTGQLYILLINILNVSRKIRTEKIKPRLQKSAQIIL